MIGRECSDFKQFSAFVSVRVSFSLNLFYWTKRDLRIERCQKSKHRHADTKTLITLNRSCNKTLFFFILLIYYNLASLSMYIFFLQLISTVLFILLLAFTAILDNPNIIFLQVFHIFCIYVIHLHKVLSNIYIQYR